VLSIATLLLSTWEHQAQDDNHPSSIFANTFIHHYVLPLLLDHVQGWQQRLVETIELRPCCISFRLYPFFAISHTILTKRHDKNLVLAECSATSKKYLWLWNLLAWFYWWPKGIKNQVHSPCIRIKIPEDLTNDLQLRSWLKTTSEVQKTDFILCQVKSG
jgi:hypothetical protein